MNGKSDLELVRAELKQPEYANHAERVLFELEDEGRIELIRMAELAKGEGGRIDIRIVPGRLEDERGLLHIIKTDFEGLAAWTVGRLFGEFAGEEANLTARRGAMIQLSSEQISLVANSLAGGSTALLVLVEGEVVSELQLALKPFILGTECYRLCMQKTSGLKLASSGGGNT